METLATLLRKHRLAAGLSQAELAERANMSVGAIGSLEQGLRRAPYTATLDSLADVLGLSGAQRDELSRFAKRGRTRRPTDESAFQSNVPKPLSSFVWREEANDLAHLLVQHRLVTVTGTAGVGKTRTVLEVVGRNETSDVYFIDLAPIGDPDLVPGEIASALRMPGGSTADVIGQLVAHVRDRRALIVLDNCEHLLERAAATTLRLLRSCPGLRFVTTSREPLGLSGEIVFRLPSLRVSTEAVELFVARAQAADALIAYSESDLHTIAEICRRLDGIPLAIELAASRAPLLGIGGLRDRLNVLALDNPRERCTGTAPDDAGRNRLELHAIECRRARAHCALVDACRFVYACMC